MCREDLLWPIACGFASRHFERIDPKTGANVWKPAARVSDKAFERDGIAFHNGAVYYASGKTLFARNLDTGNLLWKRPLPESVRGCRVQATKKSLLAFLGAMDEPQTVPVPLPAAKAVIPLLVKAITVAASSGRRPIRSCTSAVPSAGR
jgi:hypothetical protein